MHDVIIIGGSYAGISAAMPLARARRRIAIVDAGLRRNRFAHASYGFIGRDGHAPGAIAAEARAQLLAYPTVTWIAGTALSAGGAPDAFHVEIDNGMRVEARRIVLASGVEDVLPEIPGLDAQWGTGAAACPYCHGYELERGKIGVIATGPMSTHQAMLLAEWGETTFFLAGQPRPDAAACAELERRGVRIEDAALAGIGGEPGRPVVRLVDGREFAMAGLFVAPTTRMASPVPQMLGCAFDTGPMGPFIATDAMKATSVAGVFACGDAARGAGSVPLAVGDGTMAGTAAHRSLVFPETAVARAA